MKPLHEILKEKLNNLEPKMTSRVIAKRIGVSPVYVSQMLSGVQLPPPTLFVYLLICLKFSLNEITNLYKRYKEEKYAEVAEVDLLFDKNYKEIKKFKYELYNIIDKHYFKRSKEFVDEDA